MTLHIELETDSYEFRFYFWGCWNWKPYHKELKFCSQHYKAGWLNIKIGGWTNDWLYKRNK